MTTHDDFKNLEPIVNGMDIQEAINNAYLEIGDVRKLTFTNKLITEDWIDDRKVPELLVKVFRDPHYLHFIVKYVLNVELLPFQCAILQTLWKKPLVAFLASRGASKSFLLAVYLIVRMILQQGSNIVVVGAGLRQSMVIFNYVQQIWDKAPVLRDICGNEHPKRDVHMCHWKIGQSRCVWLPMGTGEKIRGQRANVIIADEFQSIDPTIFETVVRGFAAVKSEGLYSHVQKAYKKQLADIIDIDSAGPKEQTDFSTLMGNQIIISGTAYYRFNHFYKYFSYYRAIILSGGDLKALRKEFPEMDIDSSLNPNDYAIIRVPVDALPKGMMDEAILSQGKATMDPNIYAMEYQVLFPADSAGFYLATSIQKATCPVQLPIGKIVEFSPKLVGELGKKNVMGIDPASEDDRFTINIIEENTDYRAVVYQWSTNRKEFEKLKRDKLQPIKESINDYNTFLVTHVRDLARRFNVALIVLDAAGGGVSLKESLRDPAKLLDDHDQLIYDMEDENTKGLKGRHILKLVQFSDNNWRVSAHYQLQKDINQLKLLFPKYDGAAMEMQSYIDSQVGKFFDTLENAYLEIEQCKQETILIKHEQTSTGSEKWDVPRVVGLDTEQLKKTLKKDRFTSLLLANWGFKFIDDNYYVQPEGHFGGVANQFAGQQIAGAPFIGKGASRLRHMPEYNLNPNQSVEVNDQPGRKIFY